MDPRPDGRAYARITQRSIAILRFLRKGRAYSLDAAAADLEGAKLLDLTIPHLKRSISAGRIRDYLRYLQALKVITNTGETTALAIEKPHRDHVWVQLLADKALPHLATMLGVEPGKVTQRLTEIAKGLHTVARVPTLREVLDAVPTSTTHDRELLRWSLYVYTDGALPDFVIRRYPVLYPAPNPAPK